MDISNLCLGALTFCEASGYEIKKMFESSFSHFQAISFGSIYPALARLSEQGLVTYREETQDKRPTKKVFTITAEGQKQFLKNLVTTAPTEHHRSDFLVLMMFSHLLPPERLDEVMQDHIGQIAAELRTLQETVDADEYGDMTPGMQFTLEYGITAYSAVLELMQRRRNQLLKEIGQSQRATQ